MTSVEDALSIARTGFAPVAAPRATKSVTRTVVTPRASATLERRRQWERGYRMRLRITDAAVILFAVGLTAAIQLITDVWAAEALRNAALLGLAWYLMLSALNTRAAAIFGSGATEYRRVAHAGGLAFGIAAIAGVLLEWEGLQPLFFAALPVGMLGLLFARWTWRRWLQRQRLRGQYASRTLVVGDTGDVEY
ncbi:MAG: sugar transferase, partial [Rhodoglobus sp.]|nr:sugar transferase [Rhodoglobus sp.]